MTEGVRGTLYQYRSWKGGSICVESSAYMLTYFWGIGTYFYWGDGSIYLLGDGSIYLLGDVSKSLEGVNTPIPLDLHPCLLYIVF